jgi:hypothetical protein
MTLVCSWQHSLQMAAQATYVSTAQATYYNTGAANGSTRYPWQYRLTGYHYSTGYHGGTATMDSVAYHGSTGFTWQHCLLMAVRNVNAELATPRHYRLLAVQATQWLYRLLIAAR